mgnify:CR=1 FL=1
MHPDTPKRPENDLPIALARAFGPAARPMGLTANRSAAVFGQGCL